MNRGGAHIGVWLTVSAFFMIVVHGQQDLPPEVLAYADMVLYNGKILTADERFTIAEAVAIRDGKILAVGEGSRITKMAGPKTQKIDLQGKTVVPGFWDVHSLNFVVSISAPPHVSPSVRDLDSLLREAKRLVDSAKPGEWVKLGVIRRKDVYTKLNLQILDSIAPNHPLMVELDDAVAFVNSKALAFLAPDMGGIVKDQSGKPTGEIHGWPKGVIDYELLPWPSDLELLIQQQKEILRALATHGVTAVGGRGSGLAITILRELWARGELPTRIRITHEFTKLNPNAEAYLKRIGNLMGVGDEWLKITGANLSTIDGSGRVGTWLTRKPRLAVPATFAFGEYGENKWETPGDPDWKERSEYKVLKLAHRYGWNSTDTHVQGDAAVDLWLEAVEEANKERPVKDKRFGIVHGMMRAPDQIKRLAELGAVLSFNPRYLFFEDTSIYETQFGADALNGMSAVKSMIKAGIKPVLEMGFSFKAGDSPSAGIRFPGYLGLIEKFVVRKHEKDGRQWGPQEKVTRQEALWMATSWPARMYRSEKEAGTIEPGKLADVVILGGDYMTVPEEKISEIPVLTTIIGGKIVSTKE